MLTIFVHTLLPWLLLTVACASPATLSNGAYAPPRPAPVRVQLLFGGDVMQHMPQVEAARREHGFDYSQVFEALRPRFAAADLVVVNLETTLTRTSNFAGYPCFRSPTALAGALRDAGVDVAVLANNHCCDNGAQGIQTTVEELTANGIQHTGIFRDSLEYKSNNPLYLTRRGICFALLNYTYGTNGIPTPRGVMVNRIDTAQMVSDLAQARREGAQCVAVCIHWGVEYQRQACAQQRQLAQFLRHHGADLIIGSHPHVVQPIEADSTHVVVYSLGNFVSNQRRRYCDGGMMAEIEVTQQPDGRITYACKSIPVWVAMPGYRIIPPEVGDTMARQPAYEQFRADLDELLGSDL